MTTKEKFEALKAENQNLFNETFDSVVKSESTYKLTHIETGEIRIMSSRAFENEEMPYDKAARITIAGAICFPELGFKVELIGKTKYTYGGEVDFHYYDDYRYGRR